jgi:spore coat protein A, manganese oxidase
MTLKITRSKFLKMGLIGGVGFALPLGVWQTARSRISGAEAVVSPKVKPFTVPLPIPPVLKPIRADATTDYYEITQKAGRAEILPGLQTEVWGYDGIFPGPTVEARSGRNVEIRQWNELPVPVSVHLHGGKTPPESDGYPTDLILPEGHGRSTSAHAGHGSVETHRHFFKDYRYPNEQRAATLWYHDHRMDFTGPQNYRGLSGFYIIRDEVEDGLPLPQGEKEVPLMITDRIFEEDGSFYYPSIDPTLEGQPGVLGEYHKGVFGDTILVNGAPWPTMEVSNTRYRFRILNASNARVYDLALDPPPPNGKPFVQVGSDGGLLSAPISHERVRISPAERFDVVIDFSRYPVGTEVTLKNLFGKWSWTSQKEGQTSEVMRFRVAREEKDESAIPGRLAPDLDFPDPEEAEVRREFNIFGSALGMFTVNEKVFDPERIDARPPLGSTEIWEFNSGFDHPMHIHLVHFKVLSRGGKEPGPYDAGWKDTLFVEKGEDVRVAARFEGYRGKYVFHCHNLEHEDMMMMANFEVV